MWWVCKKIVPVYYLSVCEGAMFGQFRKSSYIFQNLDTLIAISLKKLKKWMHVVKS